MKKIPKIFLKSHSSVISFFFVIVLSNTTESFLIFQVLHWISMSKLFCMPVFLKSLYNLMGLYKSCYLFSGFFKWCSILKSWNNCMSTSQIYTRAVPLHWENLEDTAALTSWGDIISKIRFLKCLPFPLPGTSQSLRC